MIKYKQVNVVHPEDVGVPRKLMSDTPREEKSPNVFRKNKLPIIILSLLVFALVISLIPWSRTVDLNFYVAETDMFYNIIAEGQMQLQGKLIYQMFQPQRLEVQNFQLMGMDLHPIKMEVFSSTDDYLGLSWYDPIFHTDDNGEINITIRSMHMCISTSLDCANISYQEDQDQFRRSFYGSIDPNADIQEILDTIFGNRNEN